MYVTCTVILLKVKSSRFHAKCFVQEFVLKRKKQQHWSGSSISGQHLSSNHLKSDFTTFIEINLRWLVVYERVKMEKDWRLPLIRSRHSSTRRIAPAVAVRMREFRPLQEPIRLQDLFDCARSRTGEGSSYGCTRKVWRAWKTGESFPRREQL